MIARNMIINGIAAIALLASLLGASPTASAAAKCTTFAEKNATAATLQRLAKVSQQDAQATALNLLKGKSTTVKSAELEVEGGCVVYSFDIAIDGKPGVEEIQVDAGTGKVVSHKHETPAQEAAEKAASQTKQPTKPAVTK